MYYRNRALKLKNKLLNMKGNEKINKNIYSSLSCLEGYF